MKNPNQPEKAKWIKVLDSKTELPEGRVMTVKVKNKTVALSHHKGKFCARNHVATC